jgi:hypothetical protein
MNANTSRRTSWPFACRPVGVDGQPLSRPLQIHRGTISDYRRARLAVPDSTQSLCAKRGGEIERRRDLLRRVLLWSLGPVLLAIGTFILVLAMIGTKDRGLSRMDFPSWLSSLFGYSGTSS